TGSRVDGFFFGSVGRAERVENIFARAGARVNAFAGLQFLQGGPVKIKPLALSVWTECAAAVGSFLPLKTEPAQVFSHRRDKFFLAARAVEVFVAQHERAADFLRALLGNPKSARVTEVQIARGRWG